MKFVKLMGRAFAAVLKPLERNGAFVVFMFVLGMVCVNAVVPAKRGYHAYALAPEEMFVDIFLMCVLLWLLPRRQRQACHAQLSLAGCSTTVLGTLLICANQNYTLPQSIAFGLGSALGYVFIVFIVREGRRRLRSKEVPAIFQGLPSSMIYIGILSLAIYGLVGHAVVL